MPHWLLATLASIACFGGGAVGGSLLTWLRVRRGAFIWVASLVALVVAGYVLSSLGNAGLVIGSVLFWCAVLSAAFCIVVEWRRRHDQRWLLLLPVLVLLVATLYIPALAGVVVALLAVALVTGLVAWALRRFGRRSWRTAGIAAIALVMLVAIVFSFFRGSDDEPRDGQTEPAEIGVGAR